MPSVRLKRSQYYSRIHDDPQLELVRDQVPLDARGPDRKRQGTVASACHASASGRAGDPPDDDVHDDAVVDHLEAIDPEIATVSNLSNAANSILIPPVNIWDRRPTIHLAQRPDFALLTDTESGRRKESDELDDHVDGILARKDVLRRTLRGLWAFICTPQGAFTAVYGFLVAFWGAAIVLFLARIINLHNPDKQGFWVEVSSQVENGLFTAIGVGFIPWRVIDTYRIIKIWHYKQLTRKLRIKVGLPLLIDEDDLPDPDYDPNYVHVLSDEQQEELHYRTCYDTQPFRSKEIQRHFLRAISIQRIADMVPPTWKGFLLVYERWLTDDGRTGTSSHKAFPINTALWICCLTDGNSIFQCILCVCMWSMNRFQRPAWTTGTLIPASFLCGIAAAVLIWRGGQRTRRTKEVESRLQSALRLEERTGLPAGITATATTFHEPPVVPKETVM